MESHNKLQPNRHTSQHPIIDDQMPLCANAHRNWDRPTDRKGTKPQKQYMLGSQHGIPPISPKSFSSSENIIPLQRAARLRHVNSIHYKKTPNPRPFSADLNKLVLLLQLFCHERIVPADQPRLACPGVVRREMRPVNL